KIVPCGQFSSGVMASMFAHSSGLQDRRDPSIFICHTVGAGGLSINDARCRFSMFIEGWHQ
ncbi:MAG TPA: hypothetical protein VFA91_05535, partial [Candidatus Polarisedimenticolia bacterium]|nr:hypothetical protein [Candidatus Polarisedimenticolia bacterium]